MLGRVLAELVTTLTLVFLAHLGARCRAESDFHSVTLPEWSAMSGYVVECFSNRHENLTCDWTSSQRIDVKGVKLNSLESHSLMLVGQACLEFWFLAPAASNGSEIRALLKSSTSLVEIWTLPALPRDAWRKASVSLNVSEPGTQVVFEAVESVSLDQTTLKQIGVGDSCGNQCDSDLDLWTDDSTRCLCSVGQLSCFPSQCPNNQICGPQKRKSNTVSTSGVCTVHHHIHYTTFDGVAFRFMSPCSYVLAKTCSPTEVLPRFTVEVVNERTGNQTLQTVQQIVVELGNIRLSLLKSQTHWVVVNGVWRKLPLNLNQGTIHIKSKPAVKLETSFGLSVSFDGTGDVHITLPFQYSDKVCGLCGNFNFLQGDDFIKPDGAVAENTLAFAESWKTEKTASCETSLVPQLCDPLVEANYGREPYCGQLMSDTGPFANCLSVLESESYFRACVSGMCSGDQGVLCKTFKDYADACREAGVAVHTNSTVCPLQCSENSHYDSCADGCPEVCSVLDLPSSCGKCEERCECNSGFRLSGDRCVSTEHCGCWYNRKHYAKGEIFVDGNCMQQCQCMGNAVQCIPIQCGRDEVCKEKDGVKGCFSIKPVTCSVYGDPHYVTFDDSIYDFQGGCDYTLTTTCGGQSPVQFTVTGLNVHPITQNFTRSKLQAVSLQVDDLYLTLNQSGEVYMHGSQVHLPYSTNDAFGTVWVYNKKTSIVLETTFGLKMGIDGHNRLFLQVDERYKYELCGLCGTYSEYQGDDFVMPNGQIAPEPFEFADSWKVNNNDKCIAHPNKPRECGDDERNEAERECSAVLGDAFHACHEHVHPTIYLNSCVYDYCDTSGDKITLCESIKSYVAACQVVGVELSDWWTGTACADLLTTSASTTQHPDQTLCPLNCNFDMNICGWEQLIQDSFDWTRHSGPTSTNLTGPNHDHTTGAGFYMYIEADDVSHGDSARLLSSMCHYGGPLCLHFWYYMYGSATSMALSTYLLQNNKATKLWSVRNNQGSEWRQASVDIKVSNPFKIIIEGIRGSNALSDVAIDDISISLGSCSDFTQQNLLTTAEVFPSHTICSLDCSFNGSLCTWSKMTTDAFDWTLNGFTPTLNIPTDQTVDGFLYVESSSGTWGDAARLISSDCSNIGPQCLQFWYYMYGSSNTMGLYIYLLQNSVANVIWWKRNDQGNLWHLAQVDFNTTEAFQVIIEGRRGTNEQSDVAIDDIKFYAGPCSGVIEVVKPHPTQPGQSTMAPPSVQVPTTVVPGPPLLHVTNGASQPPVLQVVTEAPMQNATTALPLTTLTPVQNATTAPPLTTLAPVQNVTTALTLTTLASVQNATTATLAPVLNATTVPPLTTLAPMQNATTAPLLTTVPPLQNVTATVSEHPLLHVTNGASQPPVLQVVTDAPMPNVTTVLSVKNTGCPLDCDFDADFCQWSQMLTDVFDWDRQSGTTPTLNTGPPSDHTTGGGHYLYIEANKAAYGDTARLISSDCSNIGPQCLQFWYHMYGSANTMGLYIYLLQNSLANAIWWKRNDQGNLWHLAQVDFNTTEAFQVIIEGRRGTNEQSDVAIDDIKFYAGPCSGVIEVVKPHPTQPGQSTMAPPSVQVPTTVVVLPPLLHVTNKASQPPVLQVVTEVPMLNATTAPSLTTVAPVLNVTTAPPLQNVTTAPPLTTVAPVLNATTAPPLQNVTTAPPVTTVAPVLNATTAPSLTTVAPVLNVTTVVPGPPLLHVTNTASQAPVLQVVTEVPMLNATTAPSLTTMATLLNATTAPSLTTVVPVQNVTALPLTSVAPVQNVTTVVPGPPLLHVTNKASQPPVLQVVTEAPVQNATSAPVLPHMGCQLDCDFETDLCQWSQMLTDVFDWDRHGGSNPNTSHPYHSTGGGHYLYIDVKKATYGDTARLISSDCSNIGPQCLQFWYHMYGSANTMGLYIYLLQNSLANAVWWKKNDQGNLWHLAQVDFNTTEAFQVIIEGCRGTDEQSGVAIDDIKFYAGPCSGVIEVVKPHPTKPGQSTMTPPSVQVPTTMIPGPPLLHVTNGASQPPVLQVVTEAPVQNMTTLSPSNTVAPVQNETTAPPLTTVTAVVSEHPLLHVTNGASQPPVHKVVTEIPLLNATTALPLTSLAPVLNATTALPLTSLAPVLNATTALPLTSLAPMLNATTATLAPVLNETTAPPLAPMQNATTAPLLTTVPPLQNVTATVSEHPLLHVTNGASQPPVLQVVTDAPMPNVTTVLSVKNTGCHLDCDFDADFCQWSQMLTDVFDWDRQSGTTPTLNTGPPSDHTTGGGHYLYIEATKAAYGDTARLISSDCSNIGPQCLQFWYHMYGSANTMGLYIYLLQNSLANAIWWKRNDQGNLWHLAQVDFNTTEAFQVIIEGRRGTNEQSDVAIDDIKFYAGPCSGVIEVVKPHPTQPGQSTMAPPSVQVPTTVVPGPPLLHVTNGASQPPVLQVVTEAPMQNVTTVPPPTTVAPVQNATTAPPLTTVAPVQNVTTVVPGPTLLHVTNGASQPSVLQVVTEAPVQNVTTASPLTTVAPVQNVTTVAPVQNVTTVAPVQNVTTASPLTTVAPVQNVTTASPLTTVAPVQNVTTASPLTTVAPVQNVTTASPLSTVAPVQNVTTASPLTTVAPVQNVTTASPLTTVALVQNVTTAPSLITVAPVQNVTTAPSLITVAPMQNVTTASPPTTVAPVQNLTTAVSEHPLLHVTNGASQPPVLQVVTEVPVLNATTAPLTSMAPVQNATTAALLPHTGCQLDCDFETDLCQWSQMLTDVFDWERHSGSTPTLNTGPPSDHTTGGGYYLYIEANKATFGDTARLISSECSVTGPQCLKFWYHMYGSADTMGLHVYLLQNGVAAAVWKETNNQGNVWHLAQLNLVTTGAFQILFEGRRGSNDQSDVAIDDILLHHGFCEDLIKPATRAPVTSSPLNSTPSHTSELQPPTQNNTSGPHVLTATKPANLIQTWPQTTIGPLPTTKPVSASSAGHSVSVTTNPSTPQPGTTHAETPTCAKNSHYTTCIPACSPTCAHLNGPPHCSDNKMCTSGCACDKDFVRDGRVCVPVQKCGCIDGNGAKNQFNEVWYTNHCSQKCECDVDDGNGKIDCHDEGCDDDEVCLQSAMGQFYCASTGFSECTIEGDPEYKTFDKMRHDFKGKHLYVLVRTKNLPSNLPDIYIEGTNSCSDSESSEEQISQSSQDLSLYQTEKYQELKIKVYNHTVALKQQRKVFVDGQQIQFPVSPVPGLYIHEQYSRIYLRTDFGFAVEFSGQCKAEIILPHLYKRRVEGLCGNFDGRKGNDKVKPDGTVARSIQEFGESWRV